MVRAKGVLTHRWIKGAVIHPWAFATYPALSLYAHNVGQGFLGDAIAITFGIVLCTGMLWLLTRLVLGDWLKSAIVVSVFVTIFFLHGHVISAVDDLLEWLHLGDSAAFLIDGRTSTFFWLGVWGTLFAITLCLVARSKGDLRTVNSVLNVVGLALWVLLGASLLTAAVSAVAGHQATPGATRTSVALQTDGHNEKDEGSLFQWTGNEICWPGDAPTVRAAGNPGSLPDIYYIIVDAYAGAEILKDIYQLDNSEFLTYLSDRHFYIASDSRSNYSQTALLLASSLNTIYLDALPSQLDPETSDRQPLRQMIQESCLVRFLREHGYTIYAYDTGYELTNLKTADVFMAPADGWTRSEFTEALIALTPLAALQKTWFDFRRERILYAFEHVADAADVTEPTFSFVHVLAPHWPFIFDSDGTPVEPPRGIGSRTDYEYDEFIDGYRNQLLYVNELLMASIDEILSHSATPPVIILQADHGPDARLDFDWNIEETYLPERMSILNALYLPGQEDIDLYPAITPVNAFRVVLNRYFGADLELLADRSFFSEWDHPYLFTDVTDAVGD